QGGTTRSFTLRVGTTARKPGRWVGPGRETHMATTRPLKSFRHEELFKRESATTLATIAAALNGSAVPQTPEQDATESALAANAVQWIAEDVEPARIAAAKDATDIHACSVPIDEPGHIAAETQREILTIKADHEKRITALEHDRKMCEAALF